MASGDAIISINSTPSTSASDVDKRTTSVTVTALDASMATLKPDYNTFPNDAGSFRRPSVMTNAHKDDRQEVTIGYDGLPDKVSKLGALLQQHPITKYALYMLPISALISIPLAVFDTVARDSRAGGVRLLGLFCWLEILWASLWVAKLFALACPYIFMSFCLMLSATTRKWAYLIKAVHVPFSLVIWTVVGWATIPVITSFDQGRTWNYGGKTGNDPHSEPQWVETLRKVLLASICVSVVWLVEKVVIQLIGITYNRKQLTAKLKENKDTIASLEALYTASLLRYQQYHRKFDDDDRVLQDFFTPMANNKNLKVFSLIGDKLGDMFGNIASEITGKKIAPGGVHAIVGAAIERQPDVLSRRIFRGLVPEGSDCLLESDIAAVIPVENEDGQNMFEILDKDRNGDVSLEEMTLLVKATGREKVFLAKSQQDIKEALQVLDGVLSFVVLVAVAMIYASFFSPSLASHSTLIWTSFTGLSFAFGGVVQEFFGSCIFLFVKHPYDVGDRVHISGTEFIVEKISLLYTVFHRIDTEQICQIPNVVNNSNWVDNITRSKAMKERISVNISADTSFEDIDLVKSLLEDFVAKPENRRDYQPHVNVHLVGVGDLKQLELRVEVKHKSNWSNEALRSLRRAKFMCELLRVLRSVPVGAPGSGGPGSGDPNNPSYSVTVTDEQAAASRAKWAAEKEAKKYYNKLSASTTAVNNSAVSTALPSILHAPAASLVAGIAQRRSGEAPRREL